MRSKIPFLLIMLVGLFLQSLNPLAQERAFNVVASHSILADVARNVAGDHIEVSSLIPVGADPHSFMPSPSDLTAIANADLVLLNGVGYEESLLDAVQNAGEAVNIVVASACIEILPFGATVHTHDEHMDEHDDEHDDDDDHADEHDDDHADEHDDEHADENEDDHADEHDDEHADEDEDDHADEHDDENEDDHADEHDDEHADEDEDEHADEHDDDHANEHDDMAMSPDCTDHDAEFAALVGEEEDHAHFESLGRAEDIDCGEGHGDEDDHAHAEGGCDPHLWMDPHNVIYWTLLIRDSLAALDHDNAESYAANAAAYARELVALEADFILPALSDLPLENRILVTSHESLGYFAATFEFKLITTIVPGMATLVEPSARDMAALIDQVRAAGVPAIFGDTFSQDRVMSTIAGETGAAIVGLYSDTLSAGDGPAAAYLDYMRYNVTTIIDALKP